MIASSSTEERNCALCLNVLPLSSESKLCKTCYNKHNCIEKFVSYSFSKKTNRENLKKNTESLPEHYCNLCKKPFSTTTELEEHLIEHSFRGCEERGYNCYICSAIFTLPCGLHQHMIEHGPSYQPYDCNQCAKKFYFRAELENHLIDHETGRTEIPDELDNQVNTSERLNQVITKNESNQTKDSNYDTDNEKKNDFKLEAKQYSTEEDDEYIEVEQIAESASVDEGFNNNNNIQQIADNNEQRENTHEMKTMNDEK